jgi:hypothetical protein
MHRHGCVEGRSSVEHHGQRRNIPTERQTNLHRHGDCLPRHLPDFCFHGLSTHPFFFSVLLFDVVYREETLLNVISSVTRNGMSIVLTAVLALISLILVYLHVLHHRVSFIFLSFLFSNVID